MIRAHRLLGTITLSLAVSAAMDAGFASETPAPLFDVREWGARGDAQALADCNKAIELNPESSDNLRTCGFVYCKMGRREEALIDCSKAVELDQDNASARYYRGLVYCEMGKYDGALDDCSMAVELDPRNDDAYRFRGVVCSAMGEYKNALDDFDRAIKLNPSNCNAYSERARLRATCPAAEVRDSTRAVADATRACELSGWRHYDCLDAMAAASAEAGDSVAAQEWQTKAIELVPDVEKAEFESRLQLYQEGKPYRMKRANG